MAKLTLSLTVQIDIADRAAFSADLLDIYRRFGATELEDVQPHRRSAFNAEIARAEAVFGDCVELANIRIPKGWTPC